MRSGTLCAAVVLATALADASQQTPFTPGGAVPPPPPAALRDRPATPTKGTARIRGRVLSETGAPLRDAGVTLSGALLRTAATDADGRFEFADLPAGRFFVLADKGGYTTMQYGQRQATEPGRGITLTDGQVMNQIDIALPRGSVIAGRVTDESGDPITGAEIRIERYQYGPGGRQLATFPLGLGQIGFVTTNDLGEYRVHGLAPGDYVVSARFRTSTLTTGPNVTRDVAEVFLPTYYPGTMRVNEARLVRLRAAQEATADFDMVPGRMLRISGTVMNSKGLPAVGLNVFLATETATSSGQANGGAIGADGSFIIGNVPPGNYTLRVRQQGGGQPGTEVASMPIVLGTEDLTGLRLTTKPGATIRGRVEWEGSATRPTTDWRVTTRSAEWSPGPLGGETTITYLDPASGAVQNDTFELGGIVGTILFGSIGLQPPWSIKSVTVDGTDITDAGAAAATLGGDVRVLIVLTDRSTDVTASVRDARGQSVSEYVVVVLPQQPVQGNGATRYTRIIRPDQSGSFRLRGLPPGQYVAAAVDGLAQSNEWNPEFQKTIRASGQPFTLTEGQTLTLNLELRQ